MSSFHHHTTSNSFPFLFLICTTPERKPKAIWLHHLLYKRLHSVRIYIVITDPYSPTPVIQTENEIILKASNYYEDAATKTFIILNAIYELFPDIKGVFKCEDTILPNISFLQKTIKNIRLLEGSKIIDYAGVLRKTHSHKKFRYIEHHGKCHNPKINQTLVELPRNLKYACHPFYYLSDKALKAFTHLHLTNNKCFYEDVAVAHHLATFAKIFPQSIEFFHCHMERLFQTSIYNPPKNGLDTYKTLYISLQGNLGERMFQTAAAYGLAKMKNMYLVFVDDSPFDVFHRIFLKEYPCIDIAKIDEILDEAYPIFETDSRNYDENLIPESVLATNRDVFMRGYFRHTDYFKHCEMDIFSLFHSPLAISKQIFQRKGIAQGFQSVRRYSHSQSFSNLSSLDSGSFLRSGSSVGGEGGNEVAFDKSFFIYVSETQSHAFLEKAIDYIREYEMNPYFYVLSHFDDEQTLEHFECLKTVDKTIITIRLVYTSGGGGGSHSASDKSGYSELTNQSVISDNNLIDALAIMSLCKRGGIVSHHDPVSWWGAFLNDNIRKIIVHESQSDSSMVRPGVYVKGLNSFI